ncbi:hypothetical protein [Thalassobacillus hwangdonensis]|uniref:Uncharacterized protein n=1 Tax=Thalassobacillus hwangdonensis TaxID=546108 RepID=A0ABW3L0N3_9BACI
MDKEHTGLLDLLYDKNKLKRLKHTFWVIVGIMVTVMPSTSFISEATEVKLMTMMMLLGFFYFLVKILFYNKSFVWEDTFQMFSMVGLIYGITAIY